VNSVVTNVPFHEFKNRLSEISVSACVLRFKVQLKHKTGNFLKPSPSFHTVSMVMRAASSCENVYAFDFVKKGCVLVQSLKRVRRLDKVFKKYF
jgi:hypothetical protein